MPSKELASHSLELGLTITFLFSVPLFWSQNPLSLRPTPVLDRTPEEDLGASCFLRIKNLFLSVDLTSRTLVISGHVQTFRHTNVTIRPTDHCELGRTGRERRRGREGLSGQSGGHEQRRRQVSLDVLNFFSALFTLTNFCVQFTDT
jgi:hypothetical protein